MNDSFYNDPLHRVIDPILDTGFKLIFGRENVSECLLIDLLNNIFKGDPQLGNITSLTFTNTERPNEYVEGKGIRYDIRCVTASGHRYLVEMQKGDQKHFLERSEYYVSRGLAEQGYKGKNKDGHDWDFSLVPVVGVFFCNFHVRGLERKPVTKLRLCDEDSGKPVGSYQRYAFIQLPCFDKDEWECGTKLEQWIYNIKNMGSMQRVAFASDNEIFRYLDSVSNVAALSPAERDVYEASLKRARDYYAVLRTAEEKAEEKGIAKGIEKGRAKEKKIMIKRLFEQGVPIEVIACAASLSTDEVKAILRLS